MAYVVDRVGIESIMDGFDLHNKSAFSVWQGKVLKFQSAHDSAEDARHFLEANLQGLHNNSTAMYEIRFYEDVPDKGITNATPYAGSFTFKMNTGIGNDVSVRSINTPGANDPFSQYLKHENEQLKQSLEMMQQQIQALSQSKELINGIENEDYHEPDLLDRVVGIIEDNPTINKLVMDIFGGLKNMLGMQQNNMPGVASMAGVDIPQNLRGDEKFMKVIEAITTGATNEETIQNVEKVGEAMRLLLQKDSALLNTLHTLSQLTQEKYNMAKSFL